MSLMPRRFPGRYTDYLGEPPLVDNVLEEPGLGGLGIDWAHLRAVAFEAMQGAYAPYSGFPVGAAALVSDGRIVRGTNVENASYGITLCAECGVVSQLYATGGGRLVALTCVGRDGADLMPCGRCRQLLWEHGGPDMLIATAGEPVPLSTLLPLAFGPDDLARVAEAGSASAPRAPGTAAVKAPDPHLSAMLGQGTVFVHQDVSGGARVWTAYWDSSTGTGKPQVIDEAPSRPTAADALAWGLARTRRVIVVDADGQMYWAGEGPAPAEIGKVWSRT